MAASRFDREDNLQRMVLMALVTTFTTSPLFVTAAPVGRDVTPRVSYRTLFATRQRPDSTEHFWF